MEALKPPEPLRIFGNLSEPHSIRWLGLKSATEAVYECYASDLSVLSKFAAEKIPVANGLYKYVCSYIIA